jgi:hypothetical protein
MTAGGDNQVLLARGWTRGKPWRDVAALDSCCKISESLTALEWVPRGRFVGNPETGDKTSFEDISPLKSARRK